MLLWIDFKHKKEAGKKTKRGITRNKKDKEESESGGARTSKSEERTQCAGGLGRNFVFN